MNIKKLIGAIIGVTAFAALIAGATFAWISANTAIQNAIFSDTSKNFIITYAGSSDVSGFKQIKSGSATTGAITNASSANVAGDAWAAVTASKTANDAPASSFTVKLNVTENTFKTNAIVWAICKGNCPTSVALATVSNGTATCGTGVSNCGTIASETTGEVTLYNDAATFNTDASASATYNVYFWIDDDTLSNNDIGKQFAGYIHANATQGD